MGYRAPAHSTDDRPTRGTSALPLVGEAPGPWIGAAGLLTLVMLAMSVRQVPLPFEEQAILLLGISASLAGWGLVTSRSNRAALLALSEERARPAADEVDRPGRGDEAWSYLDGMVGWTTAVLQLIEHTLPLTCPGTAAHDELLAAGIDTSDLVDFLAGDGPLTLHDRATLHSLGTLWDAGQDRVETMAASFDPEWHRRWRARTIVERQLRHGAERPAALVLPYVT